MVVLAVDAASDAGRQDAAAPGQQPGPLGSVLRAADEGSTGCPQAADDDTHQATSGGPGPDGRLSPAAGQGQLHAHRGGGVGSLPSQDPGAGEARGRDVVAHARLVAPADDAAGGAQPAGEERVLSPGGTEGLVEA